MKFNFLCPKKLLLGLSAALTTMAVEAPTPFGQFCIDNTTSKIIKKVFSSPDDEQGGITYNNLDKEISFMLEKQKETQQMSKKDIAEIFVALHLKRTDIYLQKSTVDFKDLLFAAPFIDLEFLIQYNKDQNGILEEKIKNFPYFQTNHPEKFSDETIELLQKSQEIPYLAWKHEILYMQYTRTKEMITARQQFLNCNQDTLYKKAKMFQDAIKELLKERQLFYKFLLLRDENFFATDILTAGFKIQRRSEWEGRSECPSSSTLDDIKKTIISFFYRYEFFIQIHKIGHIYFYFRKNKANKTFISYIEYNFLENFSPLLVRDLYYLNILQDFFNPQENSVFQDFYEKIKYPIHDFVVNQIKNLHKKGKTLVDCFSHILLIYLQGNLLKYNMLQYYHRRNYFLIIDFVNRNSEYNNQDLIDFRKDINELDDIKKFYSLIKFFKTCKNMPMLVECEKKLLSMKKFINLEHMEMNEENYEFFFHNYFYQIIKNDVLCLHLFKIFKGNKKYTKNSLSNAFFSNVGIVISILNFISFKKVPGTIIYQGEDAEIRFRHLLHLIFGLSKYSQAEKIIKLMDMDLHHRSPYIKFSDEVKETYLKAKIFVKNFDCSYLYK